MTIYSACVLLFVGIQENLSNEMRQLKNEIAQMKLNPGKLHNNNYKRFHVDVIEQ